MKKVLLSMALICVLMSVSCSKSHKLEKAARESSVALMRELAKDPTSIQISDQETAYSNDSLCILRMNFKGKNGLGMETSTQIEYVYLVSNGVAYEAKQELDEDSIYLSPEVFEKQKVGKIYENLNYDDGIRYRAAVLVNSTGRAVGDKENNVEVKIPVPTGTGAWQLRFYKDQFNKETNDKYLLLMGRGVFSNSATTGSRMTAILYCDNSEFAFKFIEYDSYVVKDEGRVTMDIRDSEGKIHYNLYFWNNSNGNISSFVSGEELMNIIKKGGVISVSATCGEYSRSQYIFDLDVSGFENAIKYVR